MQALFRRFNDLNILIIGDIMMDCYLWGNVDRISPEAPVPVLAVHKKESRLGGAANVAQNILALGANAIICSAIGDDKEGDELLEILKSQNLTQNGIARVKARPTTVKTRVIGHNQQMVRIDYETDKPLDDESTQILIEKIKQIITDQNIHCIIFEDYDKGVITPFLIREIVQLANGKEIITVVDPKKRNFLEYGHVTLFKPNLKELREGLKVEVDLRKSGDLTGAVNTLREKINSKHIMVTLSEMGVYMNSSEAEQLIPAHIRTISDVSGAGDTVIATAALCLAAGADEFKTAAIANLAGGLVCEQVGVVPINKALLLEEALKL